MRRPAAFALAALFAIVVPAQSHAQSEVDRLREALRNATVQLRSLEDQRAVMQAKQAETERERDRLRRQNEALRAQVKDAEQAYRQAVKEFNERLTERDDTLEKWKSAYSEAATVARAKDAERAKFESESAALKASNKSCEAKNAQLFKAGSELLTRYETMNPMEALMVHEPLFGIKRVEHQNVVQDFRDKILDQKVKP
jgi:chromosome segregation ATPase